MPGIVPEGTQLKCDACPAVICLLSNSLFPFQDTAVMERLLDLNVVARAVDYVTDGACQNDNLLIMLLANVTTIEKGSEQLLQLGQGVREGFNM
jgi:hypothetical protein